MTISFSDAIGFSAGEISPGQVITGDFNQDGNLDLVTNSLSFPVFFASPNPGIVSVLLGNGAGGFGLPNTQILDSENGILALSSGDFNQDSKPDLIVLQQASSDSSTHTVRVALGDGAGNFQLLNNGISVGGSGFAPTNSLSVGDFNGDARLDSVVLVGNTLSVLVGDGAGGLQDVTTPILFRGNLGAVTPGDFNKDGNLDLAAVGFEYLNGDYNTKVAILLGDGTGNFNSTGSVLIPSSDRVFPYSTNTAAIVSADFNQDGNLDVAIPGAVFLGDGTGTITLTTQFNSIADGALATADINGDGKLDLVQTGYLSSEYFSYEDSISVLLGNGSGNFSSPDVTKISRSRTFNDVGGLSIGDFNKDGKPDLVAANSSAQNLSLLLNTTVGNTALVLEAPLVDASSQSNGRLTISLAKGTLRLTGGTPVNQRISGYTDVIGTVHNDSITGNKKANWLRGGDGKDTINGLGGNDRLVGSIGNDILTGGDGNDRFVFRLEKQGINQPFKRSLGVDKITDFDRGDDTIVLYRETFTELGRNVSFDSVDNLREAKNSRALITYIRSSGSLYYNRNGSDGGFGGGGLFADLQNGLNLSSNDIRLIPPNLL